MSTAIRVVVKVVARADSVEAIHSIVLALAKQSRRENGCMVYDVLQNMAAPEIFLLVEEWESIAALEAHNRTAHFHEAVSKSASLIAQPLEVGRYAAIV